MRRKIFCLLMCMTMVCSFIGLPTAGYAETKGQLYAFLIPVRLTVSEDGKLAPNPKQYSGSLDALATTFEYQAFDYEPEVGQTMCFAIKTTTGDYYALDNVSCSGESGSSPCLRETGVKYFREFYPNRVGTHKITGTYNGITCELEIRVTVPSVAAFREEARTESGFLGDTVYFGDLLDDSDSDKDWVNFYIIGRMPSNAINSRVSIGEEDWDAEYNRIWKSKDVKGISISDIHLYKNENEYWVCQVRVDRSYKAIMQRSDISMAFTYEDRYAETENSREIIGADWRMTIYDAEKIIPEKQLCWVTGGDYIYADEDGIIQYTGPSPEGVKSCTQQCVAQENWMDHEIHGYFAVEKGGKYYALENVRDLTAEAGSDLCLAKGGTTSGDRNGKYLYTYSLRKTGMHRIVGEFEGKEYMIDMYIPMPINGCFKNPDRLSELSDYLSRNINCEELNTNETGSEAYFYVYSVTGGELQTFTQNDNYDLESTNIKGLRFEYYGTIDSEHCIWKAVIDRMQFKSSEFYIGTDPNGIDARFVEIENKIQYLPKFCWIGGDSVYVDSNGYIIDRDDSLKEKIKTGIEEDSKSGAMSGYFGVLQENNQYKAVPITQVSGTKGLKIWKESEQRCLLEWNRFGEHTVTADYEGIAYKMKVKVSVPEYGLFSSEEISQDSYLGAEFSYNFAKESSEDGTEKYFYLLSPAKDYTASDIKILIGGENNVHEYQEGEVTGLSIADAKEVQCNGKTYFSCRVVVRDSFVYDGEMWLGLRCGETEGSEYWQRNINIYDSSYYFGDADGNKKVDAADTLYLKRHLAGWEGYKELPQKTNVSWMDEASPANLMILERHIAGWKDYEMLPYTDNFFE